MTFLFSATRPIEGDEFRLASLFVRLTVESV